MRDKLNAFDDSVIYYEVSKLYKGKIQVIPNTVYHIDDDSLLYLMKKWYKYGENAKFLKGTEYEAFVMRRDTRPGLSTSEKLKLL